MEYYNPNDNSTKRYAAIAVVVFMAVVAFAVSFLSITVTKQKTPPVIIEFVADQTIEEEKVETPKEEPKQPPKPKERGKVNTIPAEVPEDKRVGSVETPDTPQEVKDEDPLVHTTEAEEPQSAATQGNEEKNLTLNPRASFPVSDSPSSQTIPAGSKFVPQGDTETKSGDGVGDNITGKDPNDQGEIYNLAGFAELRMDKESRGVEYLHKPEQILSVVREVQVNVRLEVKADGTVDPDKVSVVSDNTTTTDVKIRQAAVESAKKSTFKPGKVSVEYIIYVFKPMPLEDCQA